MMAYFDSTNLIIEQQQNQTLNTNTRVRFFCVFKQEIFKVFVVLC